ncbi:MAG: hypothetical protein NTX22_08715 [Ignavibacteriales bacterium]|nr:hypothetical protein [Ignavibacteriales bacterium]
MKTRIVLLVLFAFTISITAQEINVPVKVKDAFNKLYPNVTVIKWVKEGKTEFEAEFKLNGTAVSVVMDAEGGLQETETDITKSELPKGVEKFVAKHHKGWSITGSAKIVDAKDNITFETQISKGKSHKELMFTNDGKLVKKNESKSEKDEGNEKEEDEKD